MSNKDIKDKIKKWCKLNYRSDIKGIRHIHKSCYVIGYATPGCLVIALPWMESEKQNIEFNKAYPLSTVNAFDPSLKSGDWCISAYIFTSYGGETIAIPIE